MDYSLGCQLSVAEWAQLNRIGALPGSELRKYIGPFPPAELMQNTTGLTSEVDFAAHGADFWVALSEAAPKPLQDYSSVLDFGCGCGRLARMFKGHTGRIVGCDIDRRHVEWCSAALDYMEAKLSTVVPPIPFDAGEFELIISISIFTHLTERSQDQFLEALATVCRPDGVLLLTVHGARALTRAVNEPRIRAMIEVDEGRFQAARERFAQGQHAFILQHGHLTTLGEDGVLAEGKAVSEPFEYGITFVPEDYVRTHWSKWFEIVDYREGALHDFQDIVVLKPRQRA
ncbi:SAM-dependent methyltransferase [Lysobacter niastensis]|uniref:SAM-dependent methyltransferase n=1 Tax=Lysobacter niastensis TaxID=380629 RepID=A0ABU1WC53_9GAMM|nr:class I SAM-dependent methyltransferase [Lysobacter niastensis]MDR7135221.1 SAM-dependent methyltransferase [Lysobacter niastensis]